MSMLIYREELDGLRCLAVIPVVFYHCGFVVLFSGGYVGVDIFFVISGYLITSILLKECELERFSLIDFYERRCRRIVPLLSFVLLLSSFIAYHIMYGEQLKEFGLTLISIECLSSNIYFWLKDDGYFSQISQLNPLVHTWSLAVEEQFYLIFPLIFYLFGKKKSFLLILLILFSLLSLFLCQWGGNLQRISFDKFDMFSQHSLASFYLPFGRIWELLIGTFSAFYLQNNNSSKNCNVKLNELFSLIGLLMIIVSIVLFDTRIVPPFPNLYTLIPTLGSTLIILFCDKDTFVGRCLSFCLFRWIGIISYSIYLWHQPLLAFIRLKSNESKDEWLIIIILIPLSLFTYRFIEKPFRNKKRFSRKQIFCFYLFTALIILMGGGFLVQTGNNQSLLTHKGDDPYLSDLQKYGHWSYVIREFDKLEKIKTFSNQSLLTNKRIVLIGDSFAQDFYNMITEGKHLTSYEIRPHFIYSHCQIYLGQEDRQQFIEAKYKQTCSNGNHIKYAFPLIRQSNIVILSSSWHRWSAQRLPTTIQLLNLTKQQKIFVIGPKNFGQVNPSLYIHKSTLFRIKQYQYPQKEVTQINELLKNTLDKSIYVNLQDMICSGYNQTCPLFTPKGKLISHDGAHLTKYGAIHCGNIILKNKPLNRLE